MFISPLRRWSGISILSFLVLLLGSVWYLTSSDRISRLSEALLSRVLGGQVTVRSGHLSFSGTLILAGVEVRTDDSEATAASDIPIFSADQIEARFDWFSLLSGQLSATQLVATTPVFRPIEDRETGHWNYERLRPGFGTAARRVPGGPRGLMLPVVVVRNAHVRWGEMHQGKVSQNAETVIDGELTPDALLPTTYHFQFSQLSPIVGLSATQPDVGVLLRGTWDTAENIFSASTDNVTMTETLRNGMPRQAREWCQEHHLAGRLSQMNLAFNPHDGLTMTIAFDGVSMMWMVDPQQGISLGDVRPAYPLDVSDVRGKIVFTLSNPGMHILNLSGQVLGYKFIVDDCMVQGTSFDSPFELKNLHFPNAVLGDDYPPLFMAFITSQDLLQRIAPHGNMDIAIDFKRTVQFGPLQIAGTVDCHDAGIRFAHFPFPLDHLNGRITFDQESVTFHDVVAKADLNDVRLFGTTGTTWQNRAIDFTVISDNTYFDDRLAASMPSNVKDLWDLFSVSGHGGFVCRVTRSGALIDKPKVVVDVTLENGNGFVRSLPYKMTNASGRLHFEGDQTRIDHLTAHTGADGTGRVEINGVVHYADGDVTHLEPELNVTADVPIDKGLLHSLPEEWTSKLNGVTLGGRAGFAGVLKRGATEDHAVQAAGTVTWSDGTMRMPLAGAQLSLSGISAQVVVTPLAMDIQRFAGIAVLGTDESQRVNLGLSGKLDAGTMGGVMDVSIAGNKLTLPPVAPSFLPKEFAEKWTSFAPSGAIDVDAHTVLRLNLPADVMATTPAIALTNAVSVASYTAGIRLHDVSLTSTELPDPLTKLNGSLELVPGKITMNNISGRDGEIALQWNGTIKPETGWVTLNGEATTSRIPATWLKYLPETLVNNLDTTSESSFTIHLDSVMRPQSDKPWAFEGRLETAKWAMKGPIPLTIESAVASGKGTWNRGNEGGFDFLGTLQAKNLAVSDHTLQTLHAGLEVAGGQHRISIADMEGKVAGGTLQGEIQIRTAGGGVATAPSAATAPGTMPADGGYTANLVLNNAELPLLLLSDKATDDDRKKVGTGRVSASLSLQQTFGPQGERTGRGDLEVSDANIYDVPLSVGLMQIVTLRLPVAHSFEQANMSYYVRDNDITFEKILLESPGVNLAGNGTLAISDRAINLNFITQTPHFTVPVLSAFQSELLQISVTGTANNPKVTPVPLSPIANMLRAILPQAHAEAR